MYVRDCVNGYCGRDGMAMAECRAEGQGCFGEGLAGVAGLGSHPSLALALSKASREAQLQLTMTAGDCVGYVPNTQAANVVDGVVLRTWINNLQHRLPGMTWDHAAQVQMHKN